MTNSKDRNLGRLEMVAAMIMMGTVGIFVVESGQTAQNAVFFRCAFGAFFLALYCHARGFFRNAKLSLETLALVALSGVFLVSNWILLFASFSFASISTSTVIYHTQPFFFVLIGAAVFREKISPAKIPLLLTAFAGVVLVSLVDPGAMSAISQEQVRGAIYALAAAALWAISAIIVKKIQGIRPHMIALIQVIVGIFVLYPFASPESAAAHATPAQWACLATLGAVHTCLTYILMYSSYRKLSTLVIAVLTFIYPAVAIVADFMLYDIALTTSQWLGVFLILISSFAVGRNFPSASRIFRGRG